MKIGELISLLRTVHIWFLLKILYLVNDQFYNTPYNGIQCPPDTGNIDWAGMLGRHDRGDWVFKVHILLQQKQEKKYYI